ncbi:hypothetical protein B7494_g5176 [Chlorociboria aeruginascens]|nr:hypothetical protein B7494_g5176 [Chlorociboria aeruginascens]
MSGSQNILPPIGPGVSSVTSEPTAPIATMTMTSMNPSMREAPKTDQPMGNENMPQVLTTRPSAPPLDTMRAYRACLNCRNRKSKCDLDINSGRPPCRRCQREAKECVLGESHRGGRRVRKKPKLDEGTSTPATPNSTSNPTPNSAFPLPSSQYSPAINTPSEPFHSRYDSRQEQPYSWQNHTPTTATSDSGMSRHTEHTSITSSTNQGYQLRAQSTISLAPKSGERGPVLEGIASADLQNPSDALEILAQVADRAEDGDSTGSEQNAHQKHSRLAPRLDSTVKVSDYLNYKPVIDGLINPEMIYQLFSTYEEFFHPYFPIIPRETFDRTRIPWLSRAEPHLFSAILTIASKDNERVHQVCYDHMQQLVSMILAGADANVEAVEALLLLSQWVSHRPQSNAVGRGEEDRVAWMYIGTALRLGYFLGIDRTSFKSDSHEDPLKFNRKRLVWSACYICDRQVSVRVGKGFWARGPGPLSGLKSSDFPSLQPLSQNQDNWALIFQANLELTQIFSNVHDILYSSKGHGWKEMLEGRYAKYLDDFRTSIRSWNDVWGSGRLKASLLLTYDYLRLYVNAFAYQATISRALTYQRDSQHTLNRPMPLINGTAPDARFIYEALDAAKSLLSTFNNFVDPETLRYMPSSYYLFIIYSAVFLYKARSTTTMSDEERTGIRRMINQTIERLQKASVGSNHMGSRYARLLQLLWRKVLKRTSTHSTPHPQSIDSHLQAPQNGQPSHPQHSFDPNAFNVGGSMVIFPSTGTFSWLDLGATWNFATQNNSGSGSAGDSDDVVMDTGMSPFDMDMGVAIDYSLLEGDNPNLIF